MTMESPEISEASEGIREAILGAARRRFLRFGPRKTTMDEVAREAGCSRTTLYAHFRNKDDLYARLLEQDAEAFICEGLAIVEGEGSARRKIHCIVDLTRRTYARNGVMRLALAGDAEMSLGPVAHAFTRDQEQRVIELLTQVIEEGVAEGSLRAVDPERVAYLMFHLGSVLVGRETSGSADYPFDEVVSLMDDVFSRGIANV